MEKTGTKKRGFLFNQVFKTQRNEIETEKCVVCGCDTRVPISMPVENRKHYVCGCGQLCESCHDSLEYEWKYLE